MGGGGSFVGGGTALGTSTGGYGNGQPVYPGGQPNYPGQILGQPLPGQPGAPVNSQTGGVSPYSTLAGANGMPPADEHVLECAYLAGSAFVELDDTAAALVQLRYFVHHTDRGDERLLDTRFVIAQLLAAEGLLDEARAELAAVRPAFEQRYGPASVHVRNLDRHADRLRRPGSV